nr:hypothetical protein [Tanacetum cinerariifolium]
IPQTLASTGDLILDSDRTKHENGNRRFMLDSKMVDMSYLRATLETRPSLEYWFSRQLSHSRTPVLKLATLVVESEELNHHLDSATKRMTQIVVSRAMVVDEYDSTMGCDADHDYQLPCPNNIVDASKAAWKALGVSEDN